MYIDNIRIIKYTYAMYGVRQNNYENMPKKKKQVFVPNVYKNHIHLYIRLSTMIENNTGSVYTHEGKRTDS